MSPNFSRSKILLHLLLVINALAAGLLTSCKEAPPKNFAAQKAEQGVVRVLTVSNNGYIGGSGFSIGDNTLVTNHHVIADSSKGKLVVARKVSDTQIELVDATVDWSDEELDIAILKVNSISCDTLTLSEAPIKKGSKAYAIGFPAAADASRRSGSNKMGPAELEFIKLANSSQRGIIDNVDKDIVQFLDPSVSSGEIRKIVTRKWDPSYSTEIEVLDHDVNIGHGNSGGPLFDACGRVIGINTQGLTFSIADNVKNSSRITELIKQLNDQNISCSTTDDLCETNIAQGPGWGVWLFIVIVVTAALSSVIFTLLKKPASESYTQYIKRSSGLSRLVGSPGASNRSAHSLNGGDIDQNHGFTDSQSRQNSPIFEGGALLVPETTQTQNSWLLAGNNPEGGPQAHVSEQLTPQMFQQSGGSISIGRKQGVSQLVIKNTSISKLHASIALGKSLTITDLDAANGTSINGKKLTPHQPYSLKSGDQIELGEVKLTLSSI